MFGVEHPRVEDVAKITCILLLCQIDNKCIPDYMIKAITDTFEIEDSEVRRIRDTIQSSSNGYESVNYREDPSPKNFCELAFASRSLLKSVIK